ncbi:MAG: thermonuclease family protein [Patescibacteria group bacterium]|nr:thermonuclease family protein [Patescibacteria group bacterium]
MKKDERVDKPDGFSKWQKIAIGIAIVCGFTMWYLYGFWDVIHPSKKQSSNGYYAARKSLIQKLVVDPSVLYPVVRVIDGDTFVAKIANQDITVRVLGENAPETVKPKWPIECYGPEASEEDKKLLIGHSVRLEIDPTQDKVDYYGRLLAYVHIDDGLFLEEYMIQNGFAREYTFNQKKPYRYQKQFLSDQSEAQKEKIGLWGKCL